MYRLYDYLPSGNGYKVRLVLKYLGAPYEVIEKDIKQGATRTLEFLAMNPNGLVPTLEEEDGFLLWESNSIIRYLAGNHDKTGALEPKDANNDMAFLTLGLIFICSGTLWCFGVAAFAARAAGRIRQSAGAMAWINRLLGGMFVYLGIRVAMMDTR